MKTEKQVEGYINSQPGSKRGDMQALHQLILGLMPGSRRWFLDGKNECSNHKYCF